jgi:hypothetical protein
MNPSLPPYLSEEIQVEKRKFSRIDFREPVHYQFPAPNKYGGCLSQDLSEGGIRINLSEFVALNTEITLEMRMKNLPVPLTMSGRVVWVSKIPHAERYQVGIAFDPAHSLPTSQEELRRYFQGPAV